MFKIKKVYAIRDTKTGLYSTGGANPKFKKNGKIWSSLGALKCHLNLIVETSFPKAYVMSFVENSLDTKGKPRYDLCIINEILKPYLDGTLEIIEVEIQPTIKGQLAMTEVVSDLKNKEIEKTKSLRIYFE